MERMKIAINRSTVSQVITRNQPIRNIFFCANYYYLANNNNYNYAVKNPTSEDIIPFNCRQKEPNPK